MATKVRFLYVTAPNVKIAKKISNHLLKQKLIACANIIPKIESIYVWKNKTENSKECIFILKTNSRLVKRLQKEILQIHPYEVPCIAEIKINSINQEYEDWVMSSLRV